MSRSRRRPKSLKGDHRPVADRIADLRRSERAADLTVRLAATHRARHEASRALGDWLRVEWGLADPSTALQAPFALSVDAFAEALRKALPRKRKLSVADIAAIKQAHAETVAPIAARLNEAMRQERELSAVVNAAYGLTVEEEILIWRTAPPRMPIALPGPPGHRKTARAAE